MPKATSLQNDLVKLTRLNGNAVKKLGAATKRRAIGPGRGEVAQSTAGQGTGSIASPLVEDSRTYHPTKVTSSDGLFVWSVPDVVSMTDANAQVVEFHYLAPP